MQASHKHIRPSDRKIDRRMMALGIVGFLALAGVFFFLGLFCIGPMMRSHSPARNEAAQPSSAPQAAPSEEQPPLDIEITEHGTSPAEEPVGESSSRDESRINVTLEPKETGKPAQPTDAGPEGSGTAENAPGSTPASKTDIYRIQAGTFASRTNAEVLADSLRDAGYKPDIKAVQGGERTLYRVQIGEYKTREDAQKPADNLTAAGYAPIIVAEKKSD